MFVAICTTRTLTVTTNPVSAAVAPTIADRTAVAVDAEYCREAGGSTARSTNTSLEPRTAPASPPISGKNHRLPVKYCRARKRSSHTTTPLHIVKAGTHIIRSG